MAQNPQQWARKLAETIQRGGGGGGGPGYPGSSVITAVLVLGGGGWAINRALFNGERDLPFDPALLKKLTHSS